LETPALDINLKLIELKQQLLEKRKIYDAAVKKIADRMPMKPTYRTSIAAYIEKSYIEDECKFFMIYGPLRYGKTAYAMKTLAWLCDTWEPEVLKKFVVYRPQDFTEVCKLPIKEDFKYPCIVWDDAGVWLAAMRYNERPLKAIVDYIQTIGTHYSSVIFTTPLPKYILGKIRTLPALTNVRIYKVSNMPGKLRWAKGYYEWIAPDLKKTGVRLAIFDKFSAVMPTKFYEWYIKYRKTYTTQAFELLQESLYKEASEVLAKRKEIQIPAPRTGPGAPIHTSDEEVSLEGIENVEVNEEEVGVVAETSA